MGLRDAIYRLLSRGSAPEREADELRELVTVPMFEADLLVADLADHGIEASKVESLNLPTRTLSDAKVLVRHADLDAAQAILVARSTEPGA